MVNWMIKNMFEIIQNPNIVDVSKENGRTMAIG